MGCFGCTGDSSSTKKPKKERKDLPDDTHGTHYGRNDRGEPTKDASTVEPKKGGNEEDCTVINLSAAVEEDNARRRASGNADVSGSTKCRTFAFSELQAASENFKRQNFLGEGGFGKVYKGRLEDTGEIVAIKRLDPDGSQGTQEFFVEVAFLSCAKHPNLVELIGCCFEGFHRMLVYEFMPLGSLDIHLHGRISSREQLDWSTRMKIAAGVARGLEYLHHRMNPPVVYRDLKCSNILLGEGYHAKLSDFGLARTGPHGDKTHVSTRVMGTYGYCAPEYALTGQLTLKSDIYSFGVVLLEIVTGRKAIDEFRFQEERNLVSWAKPLLADRKKWVQLVDPALEDRYPSRGFHQALSVATMCLQEKAALRPAISDVVLALDYLASQKNTSDK